LQDRERDSHNKSVYKKDNSGSIVLGKEKKGVPLSDVWDIPYLNPKAKERVGYPTQKPILLLEQIVSLVTDPNDIVLDPFCGSGTTCVAAKLLNRHFVGIDISEDAFNLSKSRIETPVKTNSELLKKGRKSYLNADQEALKLLKGFEFNVVQRNKGIDAILVEHFLDAPVLVRVQKKNEALLDAINLLNKAMKVKKSKKSILIQTEINQGMLYDLDEESNIEIIKSPFVLFNEKIM
jgi:site-specific DNA-methyltransferase (adenine-specific)